MGILRTLELKKAATSRPPKTYHGALESALERVQYLAKHINAVNSIQWIPTRCSDWRMFEAEVNQNEFENEFLDRCSLVSSISSLATVDNQPGTGRTLDNIFYKPCGRAIEKILIQLELRYFHSPEKNAKNILTHLGASDMPFGDTVQLFDHPSGLKPRFRFSNGPIGRFLQNGNGGMTGLRALYCLLAQAK